MSVLWVLFLLIPCVLRAEPPTGEQKQIVMDWISDGLKAREAMLKAFVKGAAASAEGDEGKAGDLYEKAARMKAVAEENFHQAIIWTQTYYDLYPPLEGTIAGGPIKGINSHWNPRFFDPRIHNFGLIVESKDKKGKLRYLGGGVDPNTIGATTLDDGQAFIFLGVFEDAARDGDPGYLAATLYHESVHHTELITKGWKSAESVELNAHEAVKKRYRLFYPNANQQHHVRSNDDKIAEYEPFRSGLGRFPYATPERERKNKKWKEVRKQIEEEREALILKARQSREERYLYQIGDIAKRLCDGSGGVSQEELDDLPPISDGPSFSQKHCTFGLPDIDNGPSCREEIFLSLCLRTDPEKRPYVDQLRGKARYYNHNRYMAMSDRFAQRLCADSDSVTQAELDGLPHFTPLPLEYLACALSRGGPSCEDSIYGALCESAGAPRHPDIWVLRIKVSELKRPPAVPVIPVAPPGASFQLASVARKACLAPGSITERDLAPLYEWFPNRLMSWSENADARRGLDACAAQLYDALLGFNWEWVPGSRLSAAWINESAAETRRREQPAYSPPDGDSGRGDRPYSGPCGNGGSCCRWKRGC